MEYSKAFVVQMENKIKELESSNILLKLKVLSAPSSQSVDDNMVQSSSASGGPDNSSRHFVPHSCSSGAVHYTGLTLQFAVLQSPALEINSRLAALEMKMLESRVDSLEQKQKLIAADNAYRQTYFPYNSYPQFTPQYPEHYYSQQFYTVHSHHYYQPHSPHLYAGPYEAIPSVYSDAQTVSCSRSYAQAPQPGSTPADMRYEQSSWHNPGVISNPGTESGTVLSSGTESGRDPSVWWDVSERMATKESFSVGSSTDSSAGNYGKGYARIGNKRPNPESSGRFQHFPLERDSERRRSSPKPKMKSSASCRPASLVRARALIAR